MTARVKALPLMIFLLLMAWQVDNSTPFNDPDTGWHIKAGEWMIEHGKLPRADIWSFTAGDTVWYNISWLFDVVIASLHNLGGLPLLFILTAITYSAIGAMLAQSSLRKGAGFIATAVIFGAAIGPMIIQVALCRPNMISALFLLLSCYLLSKDRQEPSWKSLLILPLVMALWVNIHGGFLILFVLLGCHGIESLIQKDSARTKRLIIIGLLVMVATLVNPYGYHLYEGVMRTLGSVIREYINEWRPVNFSSDYHYVFYLVFMLLGFRPLDKTVPIGDKLFGIIALVMTLASIRHGLVLAIATGPMLAANLTRTLQESPLGAFIIRKDTEYNTDIERPKVTGMTALICLLLIFALIFPTTRSHLAPKSDQLLAQNVTPQRLLNYIEDHYPGYRWLNEYGMGGPLIYYGAPSIKIFVDGRTETAYPTSLMKDYMDFMEGLGNGRKANNIIKKYEIDGLIFTNKAKITDYLGRNLRWERVYKDDSYTVFIRRLKAN